MELESYFTNELRLVLPAGYTDHTVHLFIPPNPRDRGISFSVGREVRTEEPLVDQVESALERIRDALKGLRVVGRRERELDALPAYEVRLQGKAQGQATYQRIAFVDHYGTMVSYTASSPRAHKQRLDVLADRWFDSLRFVDRTP